MQDRDPSREPGLNSVHHLGSQGYLGDEDDAISPGLDAPLQGTEVHLGLATPGDAMNQEVGWRSVPAIQSCLDLSQGAGLLRGWGPAASRRLRLPTVR